MVKREILNLIKHNENLTASDIAKELGIRHSSVWIPLERMRLYGLVKKFPVKKPKMKTQYTYKLTKTGLNRLAWYDKKKKNEM
jgi:predicted transcriptional regulator